MEGRGEPRNDEGRSDDGWSEKRCLSRREWTERDSGFWEISGKDVQTGVSRGSQLLQLDVETGQAGGCEVEIVQILLPEDERFDREERRDSWEGE